MLIFKKHSKESMEILIRILVNEKITKEQFDFLSNDYNIQTKKYCDQITELARVGIIDTKEAATLIVGEESRETNLSPSIPERNNSAGLVRYHEICGCSVCHCIMANKLVDPNLKYTISTTSTGVTFDENKTTSGCTNK